MKPLRSLNAAGLRGFTLIEVVIVVMIMAIVAGVSLPIAGKVFDRKARDATRDELRNVDEAVRLYFDDTGALPATASSLLADPGGVAGWAGPYLTGAVVEGAADEDFDQDAWGEPYVLSVDADTLTITSGGPDRATGTSDDIVLDVDVTLERRRVTEERMRVINLAILLYNEDWLSPPSPSLPDPLSTDWTTAVTQLVTRGYLPNDPRYATDGWGDPYQSVGGVSPVVEIESVHF